MKARSVLRLAAWVRFGRRREERGAILVLAAVGIVMAVIMASLAVDLGQIAQERRRDQKVADLAALDAARGVSGTYQSLARLSADRNNFPANAGDYNVTAVEGVKTNGSCVATAGAGKVCVTVTSPVKYAFQTGSRTVTATAQAGIIKSAGFTIGSSVATASLDTEVPILDAVFTKLLGASGTVSLVSYQGLANANVSTRMLATALGFGTVNQLLTSNITLGQLLTATATVLNNQGTAADLAARTKVLSLQSAVTNTTQIKLGDYLKVATGYEDKAADGKLNVLQMITAAAELANKNHFIDAGSVISIPNPLNGASTLTMSLGLKVIQPPQHYFGPVGGSVSTGQVELTLTPHIDVNTSSTLFSLLNILLSIGTEPIRIVGDIPMLFTAGAATGTLTAVNCTGSPGITVGVQRAAITTSTSASLSVYIQGASLIPGNVKANVAISPTTATAGAPATADSLSFAYPTEFTPSYAGKSTGGAPVNVNLTSGNVTVTAGVGGLTIPLVGQLTASTILTAILNPILVPITSSVLTKVATPALKALGLALGPVDVTAVYDEFSATACGQPGLQA